jgi:2-hydroxy-3-keto-5-methylthiopentenyl-1-phosphate phosphatase
MKLSLFLDFDGTISTVDVGRSFFTRFSSGRILPLVEKWARREISSVECLREEAKLIHASEADLDEFSSQFGIDPGFSDLYDLCMSHDTPVYIVSDGLDIYIKSIMQRHGFGHVPVLANRAIFKSGKLEIEFPYLGDSCGHCGNCKGSAIERLRRNGDRSVFAGDGYSDLCAVDVADYLFAKGDLADYLARSGKEFLSFDTLRNVASRVREIIHEAT